MQFERDKIEVTTLEHYALKLNKYLADRIVNLTRINEIHTSSMKGLYIRSEEVSNHTNEDDDEQENTHSDQDAQVVGKYMKYLKAINHQ
jgi:hypothetical protein